MNWHGHVLIQLYQIQMNGPWLTDSAQILGEYGDPPLSNKIYQWAVKSFPMRKPLSNRAGHGRWLWILPGCIWECFVKSLKQRDRLLCGCRVTPSLGGPNQCWEDLHPSLQPQVLTLALILLLSHTTLVIVVSGLTSKAWTGPMDPHRILWKSL